MFHTPPPPRPQPPGPAPKSQANANGAITSQAASCAPVGGREARACRALYFWVYTSLRSLYSFVRPFFSYHMALALYFGIRLSSHTTHTSHHTHIYTVLLSVISPQSPMPEDVSSPRVGTDQQQQQHAA